MRAFLSVVFFVIVIGGCSVIQTLTNISRLKFKLDSVKDVTVNNIPVSGKTKLADFNSLDILKLTSLFASGQFPVRFNINVAASNPNDGIGGYPSTDITLKSFQWDLYINEKKAVSGNIKEPVVVPGIGENKIITLFAEVDLFRIITNKGLEEIINLALVLSRSGGVESNIKIVAQPVIGTPLGDIKYPDPVTIVSKSFN
ncbi:MAG: hypothetical protein JW995_13810 [Melioribacteraceae bacterium]|nr:hypothetical protein [Melioribacteraceae bacterium]